MWQWILTVECEGEKHLSWMERKAIFIHPFKDGCLKLARAAGWAYGKRTLCPHCNPRSKVKS